MLFESAQVVEKEQDWGVLILVLLEYALWDEPMYMLCESKRES